MDEATPCAPDVPITQRVLVLGAGMTTPPVIEYLTRYDTIAVTLVSNIPRQAEALASSFRNTTPVMLDVQKYPEILEQLIKVHDIVISNVPYELHNIIANKCIKLKTNMMTASYAHVLEPGIHEAAKNAGICIGMEFGLDPGIDHMLAMECIDDVKDAGGKITSFQSYCGGLPAPESANNPLGYKFSWNPRAALMTVKRGAKYLQDGKTITVDSEEHLLDVARPMNKFPGFRLEALPNRDSIHYKDHFDIQTAHTVVRSTLRYEGFTSAMSGLHKLGLFNMTEEPIFAQTNGIPCHDLLAKMMGRPDASISELTSLVYEKIGRDDTKLQAVKELGLFSDELVIPQKTAFDTLVEFLKNNKKFTYKDGERDLVLLMHETGIEWHENEDNKTKIQEMRRITLIEYGEPNGHTAMSRTVGFPVAIATKLILDGDIKASGIFTPVTREIYKPVLKKLRTEGITSQSTSYFN